MAEVLSQSQIDALLAAARSGGDAAKPKEEAPEKKYRKYDFYSPRKFTKDRIKMLSGIYENYSRALSTRINGLVHATCEVAVDSVEEQRYYEFSNALTDGAVVALVYLTLKGEREETPIILYATPTVMVSMMDRMMGGNGDVEDDLPSDYEYTDLDLRLYERLMHDFVGVMGGGWENYIHLDFEFGRVEPNPTMVQLIRLEETVVLVGLDIKFANCDGRMNICLPGTMLSNIFAEINRENPMLHSSREDHSKEIYDQLRDTDLEITAELGRTSIQLRDVYNLCVGDVINLGQKKDSTVSLRIGGYTWFGGLMGSYDKHLAVKIKEVYQEIEKGSGLDNEQ